MSSNILDIEKIRENFPVSRFFADKHGMFRISEDLKEVISEISLKIWINGTEYGSLLCINELQREMACGFLFNEGVINSFDDIKNIDFNESYLTVNVDLNKNISLNVADSFRSVTSGCGKKNESTEQFRLKDIVENMKVFNDEPPIFKAYGGVHGAKYVSSDFSVLVEDIGRHNCIDKIAGIMLEKNVKRNGIMFVSGRISSEIITKIVRMEIPVIVSRSTPTVPAIKLAQKYGVTVIGYLRGESGIIYSGRERVSV
jgi:FdhD protein